jgi:phosphatidylinositol glycan class W
MYAVAQQHGLRWYRRSMACRGVLSQNHVSEYGTHCNFFFVFAIVTAAAPVMRACAHAVCARARPLRPVPLWAVDAALAVAVAAAVDVALRCFDLQTFLVSAPRTNLLTSNREGLACIPGVLASRWSICIGEQ